MSHEPVLVKALDMEWGGTLPCSAVFRRMRNDAYDFAGFALSKRCYVYEATRECERNVKAVGWDFAEFAEFAKKTDDFHRFPMWTFHNFSASLALQGRIPSLYLLLVSQAGHR